MKTRKLHVILFFLIVNQASSQSLPLQNQFCTSSGTFQGNWSLIGPKQNTTQMMGRIDALWVDPENENHVLAGSISGGLFESTDNGQHWLPKTNNLPGVGVVNIAVHGSGPNDIIVLATSTLVLGFRGFGLGIVYSTDGGNTWAVDQSLLTVLNDPLALVSNIKFVPQSDALIVLTAAKDAFGNKIQKVLRKSSIYATVWNDITPSNTNNTNFFDLEFSQDDPNVFWVTGNNIGTGAECFYTTDGGINWTNISSTLTFDGNSLEDGAFDNTSFFNLAPADPLIGQWYSTSQIFDPNRWTLYNNAGDNEARVNPPFSGSEYLFNRRYFGVVTFAPGNSYSFSFSYSIHQECKLSLYLGGSTIPQAGDQWVWSGGSNFNAESGSTGVITVVINQNTYPDRFYFKAEYTGIAYDYSSNDIISVDDVTWNESTPQLFDVSFPNADEAYVYYRGSVDYINHYLYTGSDFTFDTHKIPTGEAISGGFVVSPMDTRVMYAGGYGPNGAPVYSVDNGTSFSSTGYTGHADIRQFQLYKSYLNLFHPGTNDKLIAGNDGGISKTSMTTTGANPWQNINGSGLAVNQFYGFSGIEEDPSVLYGGCQDNGTFKLASVNPLSINDGDGYGTECYQESPGTVKVFSQSGGGITGPPLIQSKENPVALGGWTNITPSQITGQIYNHPMLKHPGGKFFVGGGNDLYYTQSGDPTGTGSYTSAGLNGVSYNNNQGAVVAFDAYEQDDGWIYAGFNNGDHRFFVKKGSGALFWDDQTTGLPYNTTDPNNQIVISDIVVDPGNHDRAWVTFTGFEKETNGALKQVPSDRVYFTEDAGDNWHAMSTGLPNFPVECIVYQKGTGGILHDDILYIGTDAGIFRWAHTPGQNSWTGQWECFSSGLPACIIPGLEINYCAGKLRACSFGRGIWESDLYPQTLVTPGIQNSDIWNTDRIVSKSFEIPNGQTLTINSGATISMAANTYIKVMPGGKIDLGDCHLTNTCGYLWSGIQVLGNPAQSQTAINQGTLVMHDGATIENAYVGVMADEAVYTANDYTFPNGCSGLWWLCPGKGGGILQIDKANFINCRMAITMNSYHAPPPMPGQPEPANVSYITRSNFVCNAHLNPPDDHLYTMAYISLLNVHGVRIQGNIFTGNPTSDWWDQGIGIISGDADYIVTPYCLFPGNCPTKNEFNFLYRGIDASVYDPSEITRTLLIDQNVFSGTNRAIYLSGYNNAVVTRNTFNIDEDHDAGYGLYTSACTGFTIEENRFLGPDINRPWQFGMIINSCFSDPGLAQDNVVYKNYFFDIWAGAFSVGINAGSTFGNLTPGLVFSCNEFTRVKYNIAVTSPLSPPFAGSIKREQGSCLLAPAGNKFYPNQYVVWELYKDIDDHIPITYHHHNNYPYVPNPLLVTMPQIKLDDCHYAGDEKTCPSHFTDERYEAKSPDERKSNVTYYQSKADSLSAFIDGGNTGALIEQINDPNNTSADLRNNLIEQGPYLSDTVLSTAIKRPEPMTNNDLKAVVLNNSPVQDTVYNTLEIERPPIANSSVVANAQEGTSAMEELQANIGDASSVRAYELDQLTTYYLDSSKVDSAKAYLLSIGENLRALPYAVRTGDYDAAQATIDALPTQNTGASDFKNYYSLILSQAQNGQSLLNLDSTQIALIEGIANQDNAAGYLALNFLAQVKGQPYSEIIPVIDTTVQSLKQSNHQNPPELFPDFFSLIPNPASTEVTIDLNTDLEDDVLLEVYDVFGKMIEKISLSSISSSFVINTSKYKPGIYFCELKTGEQTLGVEKLVVIR
ncbi:MAG TPA: T9SS type A sorting domain-containing protein [Chitinophagales bacterium]|nr:T9SS type A sorting domain-containing protein [Chitinophagales bacterium]